MYKRAVFVITIFLFNKAFSLPTCQSFDDLYSESGCTVKAQRSYEGLALGEVDVKIYPRTQGRQNTDQLMYIVGPYSIDASGDEGEANIDTHFDSTVDLKLKETIFRSGADAVYFDYTRVNSDYLQNKSYALEAALKQINNLRGSTKDSVLLGISLGGVIGRYAVTTMEQGSYNHGIKYYISYDSPHLGAHIPQSLQKTPKFLEWAFNKAKNDNSGGLLNGFIELFDDIIRIGDVENVNAEIQTGVREAKMARNNAAMIYEEFFNQPAAQQLLIQHIESSNPGDSHPYALTLRNELTNLGLPRNTEKNIAVALGSITGAAQSFSHLDSYVTYNSNFYNDSRLRLNLYILHNVNQSEREQYFYGSLHYPTASSSRIFGGDGDKEKNSFDYLSNTEMSDVVPCSTLNIPEILEDQLKPQLDEAWPNPIDKFTINTKNSCFIPVVSALAIENRGYDTRNMDLTGLSPFHHVIANGKNNAHNQGFTEELGEELEIYLNDTYLSVAEWLIPVLHILN